MGLNPSETQARGIILYENNIPQNCSSLGRVRMAEISPLSGSEFGLELCQRSFSIDGHTLGGLDTIVDPSLACMCCGLHKPTRLNQASSVE